MVEILLGNFFSVCATVTDTISTRQKDTNKVLFYQTLSQVIYILSSLSLKGYSAVSQNVVNIFRNMYAMSGRHAKRVEYSFVVLSVVLGVLFNNRGFFGLFPVIGNLEYTIAVFRFKNDEYKLKIAFLITVTLCTIFNLVIYNYVGFVANCVVLFTNIHYLIKGKRTAK